MTKKSWENLFLRSLFLYFHLLWWHLELVGHSKMLYSWTFRSWFRRKKLKKRKEFSFLNKSNILLESKWANNLLIKIEKYVNFKKNRSVKYMLSVLLSRKHQKKEITGHSNNFLNLSKTSLKGWSKRIITWNTICKQKNRDLIPFNLKRTIDQDKIKNKKLVFLIDFMLWKTKRTKILAIVE